MGITVCSTCPEKAAECKDGNGMRSLVEGGLNGLKARLFLKYLICNSWKLKMFSNLFN